jgi:molybdopterin-guanine dinucleotide biosynthesis protein A
MTAALILAGGAGSRMGNADKAFVTLNNQPLIAHLLARLAPQAARMAISANGDPARFSEYGLPVLADGPLAGKGPLAGVSAGLAWAKSIGADALFTIPVDTPFIPTDVIARLAPAPAAAVWQGRQHHLVSLWKVDFLPALLDFLSAPGAYKVRDALTLAAARQVVIEGAEDPFHNINTPEDLSVAQERLRP